jgi:hypothetical protein
MPIDIGYIALGGGGIEVRIYYQIAYVPTGNRTFLDAPLVNGPRGYCLDVTNSTGGNATVEVDKAGAKAITLTFGQGDPVLTGQLVPQGTTVNVSRTAAQMSSAGFATRGSVGEVDLTIS